SNVVYETRAFHGGSFAFFSPHLSRDGQHHSNKVALQLVAVACPGSLNLFNSINLDSFSFYYPTKPSHRSSSDQP
ncbi:unnamed protein product, partial [Brassica rapa subsp. trilocularis]